MHLKSASTSQGYLHLCTNEKMWAVKQVSTSNSVYITESTGATDEPRSKRRKIEHEKDEEVDVEQRRQQQDENGDMTAISQVKSILELIDVDTDAGQVESMVRKMLPLYHNADDDDDVGRYPENDPCVRMEDMLHDVPAPDKVILDVARKLFVFALSKGKDEQALYVPTSSLLLRSWNSLIQAYTLSPLKTNWDDVKSWLDPVLADMKRNIDDENESSLLTAVAMASLRQFAIMQGGSDFQHNKTFTTVPEIVGWDGGQGCTVVGQWLLKSLRKDDRSNAAAVSVEGFKQQWEQILPDSWATQCDVVSLVKSSPDVEIVTDDNQGKEMLKFPTATALGDLRRTAGINSTSTTTVNDAKAQKKRKWHEKFGAQRNAATKK